MLKLRWIRIPEAALAVGLLLIAPAPTAVWACGGGCAASKLFNQAADRAAREAAERAAKEAADRAAREAASTAAAKEAADRAAKEAADRAAKEAVDRAAKEAADRAAKEAAARDLAAKAARDDAAKQAVTKVRQRKLNEQAKRDAALAKLRQSPPANDNASLSPNAALRTADEAKKAQAIAPTGKAKEEAGAAVRKAELDAQTAKAIDEKVRNAKWFQKRKAENQLALDKRIADQKKVETAARLAEKRGFQRLTVDKRSRLKTRVRETLAESRKTGVKPLQKMENYVTRNTEHILVKHGSNGTGQIDEKFPASWTKERIWHNTSDVMTDPKSVHVQNNQGTRTAIGVRDGQLMGVNYRTIVKESDPMNGLVNIDTAYPFRNSAEFDRLIDDELISLASESLY